MAFGAATAAARLPAQTPGPEYRLINLVRPGEPGFDTLLDANFPGIRAVAGFPRMEPMLAIVHNESTHAALAYMVKWTLKGASGSPAIASYLAMQRPANPGQMSGRQPILRPNEYELVSPFFYWSPERFPDLLRRDIVAVTLATDIARPLMASFKGALSIRASIDGTVYDDGLFVGPNTLNTYERFHADQEGQRSEANWVLEQIGHGTDQLELGTVLRQQMAKGSEAADGDDVNAASLAMAARGAQAGRFYEELRKMGIAVVRISAIYLSREVPLVLHRASTQ